MNILFTIYHPLGGGGAEVSTKLLAHSLKKRGHKVILASTGKYEAVELRDKDAKRFHGRGVQKAIDNFPVEP